MTPHSSLVQALCGSPTPYNPETWVGAFQFSPQSLFFQGHFPGDPVLPGVVQVMAACFVAAHGEPYTLSSIKRCKFTRVVRPNEMLRVEVSLSDKEDHRLAKAILSVDEEPCASITIELKTESKIHEATIL